ncbi:hypothetical protein [Lacticaseibacillus sp. N501-2]
MEYQTLGSGTFPLVTIRLNRGDSVQIESGAMVYPGLFTSVFGT